MLGVVKKTFSILAVFCYVLIFVLILILAPLALGYNPVIVQSPSMEPAIETGSVVYYKSVESIDELSMGDVITFKTRDDGPMITHRLMSVGDDGSIRTMGDNNPTLDAETITFENVVGKVGDICLPWAGYLVAYAQNPLTIAVLVGVIVANIVLGYVGNKKEDGRGRHSKT